jgi:FixJ family two-component response regulator
MIPEFQWLAAPCDVWGLYFPARTSFEGKVLDSPVISIVDDDEFQRDAIRRLLRSHGYQVHSFASAEDFLKSGFAESSACVISDVQLPAMDGLAMQAALRAKGNKVPFIFITGFPNPATESRAKIAGALCLLHKPFDSDVMIKCLQGAVKDGS